MKTVYHVLKILDNVHDIAETMKLKIEKNATIEQIIELTEYVHLIVKTLILNITVETTK
jgi:hypothetical protein